GYFVNPIVLRARLGEDVAFRAALAQIHQAVLAGLEHQDYPFSLLVERLTPSRDPSRAPIFQAMFVLEQSHRSGEAAALAIGEAGERFSLGQLSAESVALPDRGSQVDVSLLVADSGGRFSASLRYSTDLFAPETMARFAESLLILLAGIVADPGC